jgi:ABC-type Mn2+/Zn2+ transport system ATPase subunit
VNAVAITSLIRLENAAFGYNGRPVLRGVSLDVLEGEFVGLIGPNGAGKSTLFKGMLRLIPALAGSVWHDPRLARRIGFVPQRDQLDAIYPLSVFDVAQMGVVGSLPWYRFPNRTTKLAVDACLDQVGMADKRDRLFAELSGGQRQRVLIARALVMNPELLVLDEPTAGIDPVAEEAILRLLGELNRRTQLTILMVSHHIQSLRHNVQRAILVKNSTVVSGASEELLHPEKVAELLS